jgi:hypothetical protein
VESEWYTTNITLDWTIPEIWFVQLGDRVVVL